MLLAASVATPDGSEFLKHPDFPTVSAFFFGWVFFASLSALLSSSQLGRIILRFRVLLVAATRRPSTDRMPIDKMSMGTASTSFDMPPSTYSSDNLQQTLITMLFISFLTGSLANFGSLLSFSPNGGLCAFSVAWGDLSTETARLMALFVLLLTLRHLGMKRWELIISLVWLLIGLVFVFIDAALATGVTRPIPQLQISLCYRRRFPPASVVSSSMYFILEVFIVIRMWYRLPQARLHSQKKWAHLLDIRILRALSLVLLNLLTAVPSAIVTSTLLESIPYSIGAIAVLLAYGQEADDWELNNRPHSPDVFSSPVPDSVYPVLVSTDQGTHLSVSNYPAWTPHHPYSAHSLRDPAFLQTWDEEARAEHPSTARSTRTIDSVTARSIREAVIQRARREKLPVKESVNGAQQSDVADAEPSLHEPVGPPGPSQIKSKRPKLAIVTPTPVAWPDRPAIHMNQEGSLPHHSIPAAKDPMEKLLTSRFSSPTVESRSTITYPSQILRSPVSLGSSDSQSLEFRVSMEPRMARMGTNPGPPVV
jgi:hypothetical protein